MMQNGTEMETLKLKTDPQKPLILIKINRFYYFMFYNNLVKTAKKRNYSYLKDLLSFNSRHTNYVLYNEIKEKLETPEVINSIIDTSCLETDLFEGDIYAVYHE